MIHKKLIITLEQAWLGEGMGERFTFHLLNFSIPYVCTMSMQYSHICLYNASEISRKGTSESGHSDCLYRRKVRAGGPWKQKLGTELNEFCFNFS